MASIAEIIAARKGAGEKTLGKPKAAGLVLSIHSPPPQTVMTPPPAAIEDERSLGLTDGEAVDLTPLLATPMEADWHRAYNAIESELCIMRDPMDPQRAWIAVRAKGLEEFPILIKSLPLYEHPRTLRLEHEPF